MVVDFILIFLVYSFIGWVMETIFASILQRKFINRGFLIGPFTPIYGYGSVLIIISSKLIEASIENTFVQLILSILLATLLVTVLEFITGFVLEKIFHSKWWDYSNNALNIKGYICLKYSLLWGFLAFLLIQIVHPVIEQFFYLIPESAKRHMVIFFAVYFTIDAIVSVVGALDLRKAIIHYSDFSMDMYKEKIIRYKRIFLAFPRLLTLNANVLNHDVRSILNGRIGKIKNKIKNRFDD